MSKNKIDKYLNLTSILFVLGGTIIAVGIYFAIHDLTSSGVAMSKYGNRGTGTIDGKGMVFCGCIIAGSAFIFRNKNAEKDKTSLD